MNSNNKFLFLLIILFFATWIFMLAECNRSKRQTTNVQETLYRQIQKEKLFQDSLLKVVNSYKQPDINQITNYYNNKYEKEAAVIRTYNIDSDIQFFANWYDSISN